MPNHIFTTATITGPTEALDAIWALAEQGESILQHYLPLGDEHSQTITFTTPSGKQGSYSAFTETGYGAALELWGSKWADYEVEGVCDDRTDATPSITLRFQSAWSPVVEGYTKLSTMLGISAVLAYSDEGYCYLGATAIADGQTVGEDYHDGQEAEKTDLFADVPAEPEDSDAPDFEERQQEHWEAYSEAWNALLVECEDNAHAALAAYEAQGATV